MFLIKPSEIRHVNVDVSCILIHLFMHNLQNIKAKIPTIRDNIKIIDHYSAL